MSTVFNEIYKDDNELAELVKHERYFMMPVMSPEDESMVFISLESAMLSIFKAIRKTNDPKVAKYLAGVVSNISNDYIMLENKIGEEEDEYEDDDDD